MDLVPLEIDGCWLIKSPVISDHRGHFREWFKPLEYANVSSMKFEAKQGNISKSSRGTVRGIHYSLAEEGQAKWITCVTGAIKDFIVDIRPNSPTFRKWIEVRLTPQDGYSIFIARDLGHAFISMENETTVAYLVSSPLSPNDEYSINPLDADLNIDWGFEVGQLNFSQKDHLAPTLKQREEEGRLPRMKLRSDN